MRMVSTASTGMAPWHWPTQQRTTPVFSTHFTSSACKKYSWEGESSVTAVPLQFSTWTSNTLGHHMSPKIRKARTTAASLVSLPFPVRNTNSERTCTMGPSPAAFLPKGLFKKRFNGQTCDTIGYNILGLLLDFYLRLTCLCDIKHDLHVLFTAQ